MIPAEFDYAVAGSLDEAIQMLVDGGEDAKLLAGGHSLIPLMKLRLAAPALLVDLRKVPGLGGISREDGTWRIGALTPHTELEHSPEHELQDAWMVGLPHAGRSKHATCQGLSLHVRAITGADSARTSINAQCASPHASPA